MNVLTPRRPVAPILAWEMWPPSESATVVILSLGFARAIRTARLQTVPEVGLTSANLQEKTSLARDSQTLSISSTNMFPW